MKDAWELERGWAFTKGNLKPPRPSLAALASIFANWLVGHSSKCSYFELPDYFRIWTNCNFKEYIMFSVPLRCTCLCDRCYSQNYCHIEFYLFYCIMEYSGFILHHIFWWTESLCKFVVHNAKSPIKEDRWQFIAYRAPMAKCVIVDCSFWQRGRVGRQSCTPARLEEEEPGGRTGPPREVPDVSVTPRPLPRTPSPRMALPFLC